ncbi:hypothetical protein [Ornithinibacillus sp. 179-J 7C1 HS]|uniref:hypothetical protein n=1 Tax=Ornithinibacillus sp. 179-J 7C1 HS TaxID=3142384 RepID=UPI0039A0DD20
MTFTAKTQRGLLLFLFVMMLLLLAMTFSSGIIYYQIYLITIIVFILLCLFIQFKIKIIESSITFEIFLFRMRVYRKKLQPEQIIGIKFKRIGWNKKCVIVQSAEGFNLRIMNFHPETIYDEIFAYADKYGIAVVKTKDYLILER